MEYAGNPATFLSRPTRKWKKIRPYKLNWSLTAEMTGSVLVRVGRVNVGMLLMLISIDYVISFSINLWECYSIPLKECCEIKLTFYCFRIQLRLRLIAVTEKNIYTTEWKLYLIPISI